MHDSTLRRLRWSLAISALFLVLLGLFTLSNIRRFSEAEQWHTHTYKVLVESHLASRALSDMDISARDYALNGASSDLERIDDSEEVFHKHFDRMKTLTSDHVEQQKRLQQLEALKEHWVSAYIVPIQALAVSDGSTSRLVQVRNAAAVDAPLMRSLRAKLREIENTEVDLLQRRARMQARLRDVALWSLAIIAGTLAILMTTLARALLKRVAEVSKSNVILENEMAQRVLMQQDVLESQLLFHTFMDHNPAVAFMKDADGRMTYVNKPLERMFGISMIDLLGKTDDQWLPAEVARETMAHDRAMMASGQAQEVLETVPTPDGVLRQWLVLKFPFTNRNGKAFLGGVAVDITERKKIEDELNSSRANLSALIENTNDAIWSVDRDYRAITFNVAFSEVLFQTFGLRPEIGEVVIDMVGEPERSRWKNLYQRAFAGEHFSIEQSMQTEGGTTDQEIVFNPIVSDGHVTGATVFSRDITERKKVERLKSEFISTVSHELRTPLTSIRGALGLLAGGIGGTLPVASQQLIEIAASNSERLVRLINDILDIEKIEAGKLDLKLKPVALGPLAQESLEANTSYAETFGVIFVLDNRLSAGARVLADSDRLLQVMTNLLSNAAKFSPRGGQVTVVLEEVQGKAVSRVARVSVRDEGEGVPLEFHERIFHKFAQADASDTRQKGGTGLGLSISKALVEKLGGRIGFASVAGQGATFFFELPLWSESTPENRRTFDGDDSAARVLICEDDAEVARILGAMLAQIGFGSDVVGTIADAMQRLREHHYVALTLDLILPDGDGVSLIRSLRSDAQTRELPIVVVSAQAVERRDELNGDAICIVDWLEKPIDTTRLLDAVRQAASQSDTRPHILHVEDDIDILLVVSQILAEYGELDSAQTLGEARDKLAARDYDLVVLDVGLPDGSGLELLPSLHGRARPIPVVIFSARDLSREDAQTARAALVKSRTSNEHLREIISALLPSRDTL